MSSQYLHPGEARGAVSRQLIAIMLLSVAILFGGKVLDVLGTERDVVVAVGTSIAFCGVIAGALFHPVRRFWWRGALAGLVAAGGSFVIQRLYSAIRPDQFSYEFAIVVFVGAIPGTVLYFFLMRHKVVSAEEWPGRADGSGSA